MQHDPTSTNNTPRPAEFDASVVQWLPFLHKMAFRLERNAQDREDLVNETITIALHRWASYNPEGSLPGWLVFQMRERAKFMRRQRSVRASSYDAERESRFDDGGMPRNRPPIEGVAPARQEDIVMLSQVADRLQGRGGRALMRCVMGDTLAEIGGDLRVSRERVRQIAEKARGELLKVAV